jgi:hypothetical protein
MCALFLNRLRRTVQPFNSTPGNLQYFTPAKMACYNTLPDCETGRFNPQVSYPDFKIGIANPSYAKSDKPGPQKTGMAISTLNTYYPTSTRVMSRK